MNADLVFFADVLAANTIAWRGVPLEFFDPDLLAPSVGSRVRCLYVAATRQIFVLDVIT